MSTAVQIRGLSKVFKGPRGSVAAVDGVDLDVEPGELYFLLGPSGCGKTTLLRMIAGFIDPTAGRILFNGKDVTHAAPNRRNTGMVFQSYALWPHMSVADNVGFGLRVRRIPRRERRRRVDEALDAVQLGGYGRRRPNELSGGQQQRVALARALVIRPEVLLLDEPLSNLDAKLRTDLRDQIRSICKGSGLTSVYVTHDQKEALSMADRIAIMREGRVVQRGTPRELYRRPGSRFVAEFLGETNFITACVAAADEGEPSHAGEWRPGVLLECAAGRLRAEIEPGSVSPGDRVVCSIRPEALRAAGDGAADSIRARHLSTTYLGEIAQHVLELEGGGTVRIAELNPVPGSVGGSAEPGGAITLTARPEDVVVLSESPEASADRSGPVVSGSEVRSSAPAQA